jgi:hypothetical protein
MNKKVTAALAGVGAVAVAGTVALAGGAAASSQATAPGQPAAHPRTIRIYLSGGTGTYLNLSGKRGGGTGDLTILNQPAYAGFSTGKRIGSGVVTIISLSKTQAQLHGDLLLPGGTIDLGGVEQGSNPFTLAVTGGTGIYQGARGEASVKLLNGSAQANPSALTVYLNS